MHSDFLYILILIIPIGLVIWFIMRKKKNENNVNKPKSKEEADEVWLTIKKYLRDKGETGKEVIDSYVVKRADPYDKATMTKQQRAEARLEEKELHQLKKTDPDAYAKEKARIAIEKRRKPAELYVVLFTTRDTKTLAVDEPRAIECEVKFKKINKKEKERNIVITKTLDYDQEMKWIKPIKDKDDAQFAKELKREQKKQGRIDARRKKEMNAKRNDKLPLA